MVDSDGVELMTVREAADALGITTRGVHRAIRDSELLKGRTKLEGGLRFVERAAVFDYRSATDGWHKMEYGRRRVSKFWELQRC